MDSIEKQLTELKTSLLNPNNWIDITLTRAWASKIPKEAGVYVLRKKNEIIYVGETGNLHGRMNDLLDSRHHTIRRTLGNTLFSKEKDFIQATIKKKFPEHIENLLNEYISTNLKLAYLSVPFGRKELEEFIEQKIDIKIKLNKRGKRKSK